MSELVQIRDVKFSAASPEDVEAGLLGWISCTLNEAIRLDGLALRRTLKGNLAISFPCRKDASGRQHFYSRPLNQEAREEVEFQILKALGLEAEARR